MGRAFSDRRRWWEGAFGGDFGVSWVLGGRVCDGVLGLLRFMLASWAVMWSFWAVLVSFGRFGRPLGGAWAVLGVPGAVLGCPWVRLEAVLGRLGFFLVPPGRSEYAPGVRFVP